MLHDGQGLVTRIVDDGQQWSILDTMGPGPILGWLGPAWFRQLNSAQQL